MGGRVSPRSTYNLSTGCNSKSLCFHVTTASKINYLSYGLQNQFVDSVYIQLTQSLILTLKKATKNIANEYSSFFLILVLSLSIVQLAYVDLTF